MRYLLMYCDGIVVDNPMRFFVDKAAMYDQPAMATTARHRLAGFLHFLCDYAPLIESHSVTFLEHDPELHNKTHFLYAPGEETAEARRRLDPTGRPPAHSPEDDPLLVEAYLAGQLAAWSRHKGCFNPHAPGDLGRRMRCRPTSAAV